MTKLILFCMVSSALALAGCASEEPTTTTTTTTDETVVHHPAPGQ